MRRYLPFLSLGVAALVFPAPARAGDGGKDLSELVVTGAPYAVSIQSTTTSVDVLKREDLDLAPSAGLGDVLASLPGVRSSFFGPGASRPVIRGLSGPRVMVLANGVGLIDASGLSPDHQVASDPQEAERIEVLRGPSALAYGGSAIGGVVNVIDGRIPSTYRDGLHGRAQAAYSTVDDGRQVAGAVSAGIGGRWSLTLDGTRRRTDDYGVPVDPISAASAAAEGLPPPVRRRRAVPNSDTELTAYGAGLSYVGEGGWGGLAVKRTESDYGVPAEEDVRIGLKQTRIDARGGLEFERGPFSQIKFAGGYADYRHTEFEGSEPGTTYLSKGGEARIELVQRDRDGWQGAIGFQALRRDFNAIGEEALIPRTRIDELGAFALQRLDRGGWGVKGGLRVDSRSVRNARVDREFTNASASAAVFARPVEGLFVGLSLSRTSRAPSEEELSSLGAHPATGAYEMGDAALGREVSYAADASLHYGRGRWTLDAHAYYADYRNFIDLVPTGATEPESGLPVFAFVESGATFHGYEIEGAAEVWRDGARSFRLEASGDYVKGETDRGPAARIPPWSLTGRGVFEGGRWTGSLEVRAVGRQARLAAFETATDSYTLLNASVVVRPVRRRPDLSVFLEGRNLTDVEAREHASFLKDIAPLPGRSLRIGVGYRF